MSLRAGLALALVAAAPASHVPGTPLDAAIARAQFLGVAIAGDSDRPALVRETDGAANGAAVRWRWASVTKQLTATIAMQEVEAGRLDLDKSIADYWPEWPQIFSDQVRIRDLLRHTSGLADPNEDGPMLKDGMPAFYRPPPGQGGMQYEATHFCAEHPRATPGSGYHYDNCDFIVLGALLERMTGKPFATLLQERIATPARLRIGLFEPGRPPVPHVLGTPEDIGDLGTYGAAGSAYGTPLALYGFDRALLAHRLLGAAATGAMWTGDPKLGAAALGQWQYRATLKGCAAPVSIVERRGQIGGVQIRNYILPDTAKALVLFTRHMDFAYGEVWQGKGFAYEALSAVECA